MARSIADFTKAADAARARGDFALAAAINSLPAVALANPEQYAALVEPIVAAIDAAESSAGRKSAAK